MTTVAVARRSPLNRAARIVAFAIGAVVAPLGQLTRVLDIRVENGLIVEIFVAGDVERLAGVEVSMV